MLLRGGAGRVGRCPNQAPFGNIKGEGLCCRKRAECCPRAHAESSPRPQTRLFLPHSKGQGPAPTLGVSEGHLIVAFDWGRGGASC